MRWCSNRLIARLLTILCICGAYCELSAQQKVVFHHSTELADKTPLCCNESEALNSFSADSLINSCLLALSDSGYLSAGIDSIMLSPAEIHVFLNPGPLFTLSTSGIDTAYLQRSNSLIVNSLNQTIREKVQALNDAGHPFARVRIAADITPEGEIHLSTVIEPGPLLRFAGFIQEGTAQPSTNYLMALTGLRKGQAYSENKVVGFSGLISSTGLYALKSPVKLINDDSLFWLLTDLQVKRRNSLLGTVGLTPSGPDGKARLSGEAQANLYGLMNHGDLISLRWFGPAKGSQELKASLSYPFIAGSRIGTQLNFTMKKVDTLFLNREVKGSIYHQASSTFSSGLTLSRWTGSSLGDEQNEVTRTLAGINVKAATMGPGQNPERGIRVDGGISSGTYTSRQEGENDSTGVRAILQLDYMHYIRLSGSFTGFWSLQSGMMFGEGISVQEQFRVGGRSSMRGFDEEEFLTDGYNVLSLGLRLRSSDELFIGAFHDLGILQQRDSWKGLYMAPGLELGIGISGAFISLQYAVPKAPGEIFRFDRARLNIALQAGF